MEKSYVIFKKYIVIVLKFFYTKQKPDIDQYQSCKEIFKWSFYQWSRKYNFLIQL